MKIEDDDDEEDEKKLIKIRVTACNKCYIYIYEKVYILWENFTLLISQFMKIIDDPFQNWSSSILSYLDDGEDDLKSSSWFGEYQVHDIRC